MDLLIQLSSKDNYIENLKSENEFSTITFQVRVLIMIKKTFMKLDYLTLF